MAWYDEAVFYHIYPLGLLDAPKQNPYSEPVHRLRELRPWIGHIRSLGCTALYIGPLFESVGHGYETTDYRRLDSRLGTNEDLKDFVATCHAAGLKVIFDAVFNHTGRDFFAFRDLREKRENSPFRDWYCSVNFWGNNSYNDGFSYDNWGGYDLLAKLNQRNPAVRDYLLETVRFWVREFDVDGLRLDAADVLDFDFMRALRALADTVKPEFWLMGEVIHGEYSRWVNSRTLHSVTDYALHKALYSGHNEHNYFEIAHTVNRSLRMAGGSARSFRLYTFVDNHDVERIHTKLRDKRHFVPVHILLYTLPGVPSLYYGSEWGIEGEKHRGGSDDAIRPALRLETMEDNACLSLIRALGAVRERTPVMAWGEYRELLLKNRQYAFAREWGDERAIVAVNCDDSPAALCLNVPDGTYTGTLGGGELTAANGALEITLPPCAGEILVPKRGGEENERARLDLAAALDALRREDKKAEPAAERAAVAVPDKPFDEMSVEELQAAILQKMAHNGPVTDDMKRTVYDNTHRGSLLNWVRSFR